MQVIEVTDAVRAQGSVNFDGLPSALTELLRLFHQQANFIARRVIIDSGDGALERAGLAVSVAWGTPEAAKKQRAGDKKEDWGGI